MKFSKSNIVKSARITLAFCAFLSIFYILVLWLFAKAAGPNGGAAEVVTLDGKTVGAANVGQQFTQDIYFWGRPSAADYNGASSAGSNKGTTNPEYLAEVEVRIDTFLMKHPYLERSQVPSEMVTASGSGLDPHISPAGATVQVRRIAEARGLNPEEVQAMVDQYTESALLGLFGTPTVHVLKLNIALDEKTR